MIFQMPQTWQQITHTKHHTSKQHTIAINHCTCWHTFNAITISKETKEIKQKYINIKSHIQPCTKRGKERQKKI